MHAFQTHSLGAQWLRPALSAGLFLLAGLLAALDARADEWGPPVVAENSGNVCFRQAGAPGRFEVDFDPMMGCLSSSCTRREDQSFSVTMITGRDREIALTSRFVIRSALGQRACTADCGGAGRGHAIIEARPLGVWRVTLSGREIGVLDMTRADAEPGTPVCFDGRTGG